MLQFSNDYQVSPSNFWSEIVQKREFVNIQERLLKKILGGSNTWRLSLDDDSKWLKLDFVEFLNIELEVSSRVETTFCSN